MRQKHSDQESVFEHIWKHADRDGLWTGDAGSLAAEFTVSEDEAYDTLSELTDRNLLQRVGNETYIITRWPEREDAGEEESAW